MKKLLILFIAVIAINTANAQFVNFNECMVFIRTGFSAAWIKTVPQLNDKMWLSIQPTYGSFNLELRKLDIPKNIKGHAFSLLRHSPLEYTIIIPFQAGFTLLNASDPALYIEHIGQVWSVYLNGVSLHDEFVHSRSQYEYIERSLHNIIIPIDKRSLKRGQNILAINIRGDPVDDRTGLHTEGTYVIDSYRKLVLQSTQYQDLMLTGIYAFFALYHGVLFILRSKNKGYLFFSISALLMAVYVFSRTNIASTIVSNTFFLRYIEYYTLFFIPVSILALASFILDIKSTKVIFAILAACAFLSIVGLFLRLEPILFIWYIVALFSIIYGIVFILGKSAVLEYKNIFHDKKADKSFYAKVFSLIFYTDVGIIIIAMLLISATSVVDIVLVALYQLKPTWLKFGFFIFELMIATILARQFTRTAIKTANLTANLEAEVAIRTEELYKAAAEQVRLNTETIETSKLLQDVMGEQERDVRVAAAVQKGFFPSKAPPSSIWNLAYTFEPLTGVSAVFYDFYEQQNQLAAISLGAVSGTGIASSLVTVLVKSIIGRNFHDMTNASLAGRLEAINKALLRELSAVGNTVACDFIKLGTDKIEYFNMDHPLALVRPNMKNDVAIMNLNKRKFKDKPLASDGFKAEGLVMAVEKGDSIFMYSSAFIDSTDTNDVPFGLGRLTESLSRADTESANTILSSIMLDFKNTIPLKGRKGDIAALVLKRL